MDFAISDEIISLRASVRRFVEDELMPLEPCLQDSDEPRPEERGHLVAMVKAQGLWALDLLTKYGGGGVNTVPEGPYGAKEVGQGSLQAAAPSIANAVARSTASWADCLPLSPETVLAAIEDNRKGV